MLLCKWNTATFWDVRLAPFPGHYPWAVIKEQPLGKMAASSFLWGPGNLFFSQGDKNILSSWVPISFETAGVSDSGLGMWFVSPWNPRVKRECAPSPSQANNPLLLKFFFFFLSPPPHWGSLSKVYGPWVGSLCLLQNIYEWRWVHCSWERVLCFHYILKGVMTLNNHCLKHGGKEHGLAS